MYNCKYCGKECKNKAGKTIHEKYCESNPERIVFQSKTNAYQELHCKYCGKLCLNINSLRNHERLCKSNPNREIHSSTGKPRLDLRGKPSWNKGLTASTDVRMANNRLKAIDGICKAKQLDPTKFTGKAKSAEAEATRKKKISNTMKSNPNAGGLRHGSGRGKKGWYNGFFCDSTYELVYVIYNLDNNIKFKRSKLKYQYTYNNELHNYYPDFEMEDGSLVEVKGYYNDKVQAKINSVTDRTIILLLEEDLQYAFEYVKENYTYDKLEDLYNGIKASGGYPAR